MAILHKFNADKKNIKKGDKIKMFKIRSVVLLIFTLLISSNLYALTFSDNFNDNSINSAWWTSGVTGNGTVTETNGQIEMVQGTSGAQYLLFNYNLTGNFVIETDYTLLNWGYNNQLRIGIIAGGIGAVERVSDDYFGAESHLIDFGSGIPYKSISPPQSLTRGKLQLVRTGSTISGYYWKDAINNWDFIGSRSGISTVNTAIKLQMWPDSYHTPGTKAAFDNFKLTAPDTDGPPQVPEPSTLVLLGASIFGIYLKKRK